MMLLIELLQSNRVEFCNFIFLIITLSIVVPAAGVDFIQIRTGQENQLYNACSDQNGIVQVILCSKSTPIELTQ
jgi:hypothetical protein